MALHMLCSCQVQEAHPQLHRPIRDLGAGHPLYIPVNCCFRLNHNLGFRKLFLRFSSLKGHLKRFLPGPSNRTNFLRDTLPAGKNTAKHIAPEISGTHKPLHHSKVEILKEDRFYIFKFEKKSVMSKMYITLLYMSDKSRPHKIS